MEGEVQVPVLGVYRVEVLSDNVVSDVLSRVLICDFNFEVVLERSFLRKIVREDDRLVEANHGPAAFGEVIHVDLQLEFVFEMSSLQIRNGLLRFYIITRPEYYYRE